MKFVSGGILAILAVSPAPGQSAGDSIRRAEQLVGQMARAYKDAPALTDNVRLSYKSMRGANRNDAIAIALGAGTDARLAMEGFIVTAVNDWFYLQRENLPGKYFGRPLADNLITTFREISGGNTLPVPQCVLRYSDTLDEQVQSLGLGRARNLKIAGHRMIDFSGADVHEIQLTGANGAVVSAIVDPQTRFLLALRINDGLGITEASMSPAAHDRLAAEITFDPSGKRQVAGMADLRLGAGDAAPDFTLETLNGEPVTLSDLRGSVVVLDFWATWCGPCRWGLPKLQEFATWADGSGHPIQVFAVDIGERQPTREKIHQVVSNFWKSKNFTMPALLDYTNTVATAFEVGPIPHTVIIGPDGKVLKTHAGLDPNMVENLKQESIRALKDAG